ncbi:hypothetical protein K525DRAFT_275453 [Schizophyllum commune Loenen D]|nr:hypothetical protein K525DRAFT_275453 [Schizophyllum commune Loenen D]
MAYNNDSGDRGTLQHGYGHGETQESSHIIAIPSARKTLAKGDNYNMITTTPPHPHLILEAPSPPTRPRDNPRLAFVRLHLVLCGPQCAART